MPTSDPHFESRVFINCPFDEAFQPLLDAIVFTIMFADMRPRCALEITDTSEVRLEKLFRLIAACKYSIHDISRTELDRVNRLPRFNMPLELGIDLGCKRFGTGVYRNKAILVMDRERYRYQKFVSDLAGQDPSAHENNPEVVVRKVRDWLVTHSPRSNIPGGKYIFSRYRRFQQAIPTIQRRLRLDRALKYPDYVRVVGAWLAQAGE